MRINTPSYSPPLLPILPINHQPSSFGSLSARVVPLHPSPSIPRISSLFPPWRTQTLALLGWLSFGPHFVPESPDVSWLSVSTTMRFSLASLTSGLLLSGAAATFQKQCTDADIVEHTGNPAGTIQVIQNGEHPPLFPPARD